MATTEPPPQTPAAQAGPPTGQSSKRKRSPWLWVSLALGIVVVGLLIWGLGKNSDLSSANDKLDQQAANGAVAATTAKTAYDDVTQDLESTNQELDQTKQDVKDANAAADDAQKQADAAKQQADQAQGETEKAKAQAEEAQAEADAATSKARVVTDCAKAYISAAGSIFEGDDVKAQAAAVKQQLADISAECKAAFEGS